MKNKIKNFFKSVKGKIALAVGGCVSALAVSTPVFAAEGDITFKTGIESLWTTLSSNLSIANIVSIIGICLGACLGLFLFWFGLRYVIRKITKAVKSGKVSA